MSEKETPRGNAGMVSTEDAADHDGAATGVSKESGSQPSHRGRLPPAARAPAMDPGPPSSVFFAMDFEDEIATLARPGSESSPRTPVTCSESSAVSAQPSPPPASSLEPTATMAMTDAQMEVGAAPGAESLALASARFAKATAQTLGHSFAGFRILRKIAEGGMASVFLGRKAGPRGFNQHAAVKVVHPHFADQRAFVEMFLDEARIAALVQHPNVCRVLDFGHANGTYFLALEYVHGEPWAELQHALFRHPEGGRALPAIAAHVISLACEGLHAAHEAVDETGKPLHIVHRDVSPQNILVAFDGTVRVLDFGIASATDRLTTTRTGTVKGRLSYMAPEQMRGEGVDARADVWSLGVVLREALEGRRLFRRQAEAATMLAVCSDPLPEWSPNVPEALRAVVDRALTREREQRYATARDLGVALSEFVRSQEVAISSAELSGWLERLFADRIEAKRAWLTQPVPEPLPEAPGDKSSPVGGPSAISEAVGTSRPDPEPLPPAPLLPPVPEERPKPAPVVLATTTVEPQQRGWGAVFWVAALVLLGGALSVATHRYAAHQEQRARRAETTRFLNETAAAPSGSAQGASQLPVEKTPLDTRAPHTTGPTPDVPPLFGAGPGEVGAPPPPDASGQEEAKSTVGQPTDGPPRRRAAPQPELAERAVDQADSPPMPGKGGTLVVAFVGGWAEVYVAGTKLGTTPGRFELPSGRTKVVLKPFGAGPEIVRRVDVPAGGQRKLIVEP